MADSNALDLLTGSWTEETEDELVAAMALAERDGLGAEGLRSVHEVRMKVIGDGEWKFAHAAAVTYYSGSVRALIHQRDTALSAIYESRSCDAEALALRILAIDDALGGSAIARYTVLRVCVDAFAARGMTAGVAPLAWRMLRLDRAYSKTSVASRWVVLDVLHRVARSRTEVEAVRFEIERLIRDALVGSDPDALIEAVFIENLVLGDGLCPSLQSQVDAKLQALFSDDDLLRTEVTSLVRRDELRDRAD